MNLEQIAVPANFPEIVSTYKEIKHECLDNWCDLSYDDGHKAKIEFLQQVKNCLKVRDTTNYVRACIGASILFHYSSSWTESIENIFSNIEAGDNSEADMFICMQIAKFANKLSQSSNFILSQLKNVSKTLCSSSSQSNTNHSIMLLKCLEKYAKRALEGCSPQFYEYLQPIIFCDREDMRTLAYNILSHFLRVSRRADFPSMMFKEAKSTIEISSNTTFSKIHGALLVFAAIYDTFQVDDQVAQKMKMFWTFTSNSYPQYIRHLSLKLIVILAPYDEATFNEKYKEKVVPMLLSQNAFIYPTVEGLIYLMRKTIKVFDGKSQYLINIFKDIFNNTNPEIVNYAVQLFDEFLQRLPEVADQNINTIACILASSIYTDSLINTLHTLFEDFPDFWPAFKQYWYSTVTRLMDNNRTINYGLKLVQILPSIEEPPQQLINKIIYQMQKGEICNKKLAPAAISNLVKNLPLLTRKEYGKILLDIALTNTLPEVRMCTLKAFKVPYSRYLAYPDIVPAFEILIKDNNQKVRVEALKILGGISKYNPSIVYPMLRAMILDILFICDSTKSSRVQVDAVKCLPIVFSSVSSFLPVYGRQFIPIAIKQLNVHLKTAMINDDEIIESRDIIIQKLSGDSASSLDWRLQPTDSQQGIIKYSNSADNIRYDPSQIISPNQRLSFFERTFSTEIAASLIDTIKVIAEINFNIIRSDINEITTIFIEAISRATHKKIIISILNALIVIVENIGPLEAVKIPRLSSILIELGRKSDSKKIHSAIFKILGQIGIVQTQQEQEVDDTMKDLWNVDLFLVGSEIEYEDYFIYVIFKNLHPLLTDKIQQEMSYQAHLALSTIFAECNKTPIAKRMFNRYIKAFIFAIRNASKNEKSSFFKMWHLLLSCPTKWLQQYAGNFVQLIEELWDTDYLIDVVELIPDLSRSLKESFSPFIPQIITLLLNTLTKQKANDYYIASKVLKALTELTAFSSNFVFIIIRQIVECIFNQNTSANIIEICLFSLRSIVQKFNCSSYSALLTRACFYTLSFRNKAISESALQIIYSLAVTMGPRFAIYRETARKSIVEAGLSTTNFEKVANLPMIMKPEDFPFIYIDKVDVETHKEMPQLVLDEKKLLRYIQVPDSLSFEHWKNWMHRLQKAIVELSPSRAFRTASQLFAKDTSLIKKFFESAFLSVWINADDEIREEIMKPINVALNDKTTPMCVLTPLVSLFEFMDRTKQELPKPSEPFKFTRIVLRAEKPTYALHCAELDYIHNKNEKAAQSQLIRIYNQLGMFDEARGFAKKVGMMEYSSLDSSIKVSDQKTEELMAKITDLENREEWKEIADNLDNCLSLPINERENALLIAGNAFYHLDEWDELNNITKSIPDSIHSIILKCMVGIKKNENISDLIDKGFSILGTEAGPLFTHGITAVSPFIINAQQLVELSEAKREDASQIWADRLINSTASFNMMRKLLLMRCDIISKDKTINENSALLKIARRSNEWEMFTNHFMRHFAPFPEVIKHPKVSFEHMKLLWKMRDTEGAFREINSLIERLEKTREDDSLLAKLFMTKARWKVRNMHANDVGTMNEVRDLFASALKIRPNNYIMNNMWAWANMILSQHSDKRVKEERAIDAIISFSRCAIINPKNCFSDLLQLSSILFRTSYLPNVFIETKDFIEQIPLKHFITILPQLVVYQHTESETLKEFVNSLLKRILYEYPNGAIFTLLFSANKSTQNKDIKELIDSFELSHASFVSSAKIILEGLSMVCVTFKEFLVEAISTFMAAVSKYSHDIVNGEINKEIIGTFYDIAVQITERIKVKECQYDNQIYQKFREQIKMVYNHFDKFISTKNPKEMLYKLKDIEEIGKKLDQDAMRENKLHLNAVAPKLAELENSPISVFGRFTTDGPQTNIYRFDQDITVLHSKQRPRQVKIIGSDFKAYQFLLKGHEDLRQDQRVMQFFELVNAISHRESQRITITSITPLTPNLGLIQWLPDCDTIYDLINEYRQSMNISLSYEQKKMGEVTMDKIDLLLPIQRYEAITKVAEETPSDDLKNVLWLKSRDAESWVLHTIAFAKSTALMSIVGYIIGLGDRHPSNIMIQRFSGSAIHIDFGDCFEVTAHRAHLAENIPFRLTRMIVTAFGECGVDGSFRRVCEETTQVLRENREAVMAVLEIFFREPLTSGKYFEKSDTKEELIAGSFSNVEYNSETKKQLKEVMGRIQDKIRGTDNGNKVPMTVHDQVDWLIRSACDQYNLACLFRGWSPLW